jgi:acetoin utilization protein AcuB
MIAAEVMTENPRTIRATDTIGDAVEILESTEVRHLPVVDDEGDLVGMLSDRDLRSLQLPFVQDAEMTVGTLLLRARTPVSAIMSSDVASVDLDADVSDIIELMLDRKIGAVPVVDGEGQIAGIVSYVDLLRSWSAPS